MAESKSLPKTTTKNWWGIRKKLKSTMPKVITKSFVAAAMNIKEVSAQKNVVAPMIQLGLLEDTGAPTKLANEWRNDNTYASACKKMRESTYPQELLDLAPDTETDKSTIQNWISSHLMVGEEAARQSTSVYMLLLEADVTKQSEANNNNSGQAKRSASPAKKKEAKPAAKKSTPKEEEQEETEKKKKVRASFDPSMNINIQIHISSDTNADQIDKIFSSMAKHLKTMNEE